MKFNKLIILTGHRKSGTSMFHRLFDSHPDIYTYPVDISILYAYFPFFVKKYKKTPDTLRARLKKVIIKTLYGYKEFLLKNHNLSIEKYANAVCDKLNDEDLSSKSEIIKSIADTWIKMFYKSDVIKPFLFKETSQAIFFNEFLEFDVPIKMISLVRDPRDNYAAIKAGVKSYYSNLDENELESLASLINRSRMDLLSAQINEINNPSYFKAIKFEELVSDAKNIMFKICDFLQISFNEILLKPTSFGETYAGNNFDGKKFNSISKVNLNKWESRISVEEAQIIEYWLKDVMSFWNYSSKYPYIESQKAFTDFYNWYNTRYFYRDSFESNISL